MDSLTKTDSAVKLVPEAENPVAVRNTPFFSQEAGKLVIDLTNGALATATIELNEKRLSDRATNNANCTETRVLYVVVDEDRNEDRFLSPLSELVTSIRFDKPGTYQVMALIVGGDSSQFAKRYLMKRDKETGGYEMPLLSWSGDVPSFERIDLDIGTLRWASPIKTEEVTIEAEHFAQTNNNRWVDVWSLWEPKNRFSLGLHYASAPFRFLAAATYQLGTAAALLLNGIVFELFLASRGFDWGAIKSLDFNRKRQASSHCVPFERTRTDADGNQELQAEAYTVLGTPLWWTPWLGFAWLITDSTTGWLLTSAGLVVLHAAAMIKVPTNDNEIVHLWQLMKQRFVGFARDLKIGRILATVCFWKEDKAEDITSVEVLAQPVSGENQRSYPLGTQLKSVLTPYYQWLFKPVLRRARTDEDRAETREKLIEATGNAKQKIADADIGGKARKLVAKVKKRVKSKD